MTQLFSHIYSNFKETLLERTGLVHNDNDVFSFDTVHLRPRPVPLLDAHEIKSILDRARERSRGPLYILNGRTRIAISTHVLTSVSEKSASAFQYSKQFELNQNSP